MRSKITAVCLMLIVSLVGATGILMAQDATETPTPEPEMPTLVGVTWQWERFTDAMQETEVPTPPDYTITFTDEETFQAKADCNHVLGTYTVDEDANTISILPGPMTLALCPGESFGNDFVNHLAEVVTYSFTEDNELLLEAPVDTGTMTFSAQPQVTGTVTYLQRIALPEDAVVRVQLQDVSLMDAPADILGEQVFVTDGKQVPFSFVVSYPQSAIEENHRYSISARITDGEGKLLFINDTLVPVITDENATSEVELILVRVGS